MQFKFTALSNRLNYICALSAQLLLCLIEIYFQFYIIDVMTFMNYGF